MDLVTVAQAFHWFDGPAALAEIHRMLSPGGRLAVLWNRRVEDEPVNRAIEDLIEPYRMGTPTHRDDAWRAVFEERLCSGRLRRMSSRTSRCWTRTARGAVSSISFIARLPEAERAGCSQGPRPDRGRPVTVPYRTEVHGCA